MLNVGELKKLMAHADDDLDVAVVIGDDNKIHGVTGVWIKGADGKSEKFLMVCPSKRGARTK